MQCYIGTCSCLNQYFAVLQHGEYILPDDGGLVYVFHHRGYNGGKMAKSKTSLDYIAGANTFLYVHYRHDVSDIQCSNINGPKFSRYGV